MATLLKGIEVVNGMKESLSSRVLELKRKGKTPCLGIVRIGERPDDLSYEKGAVKRCSGIGLLCKVFNFPADVSNEEFIQEFKKINADESVHGLLVFRPMPKHIDEEAVKGIISPEKDMDCMSPANIAKVFAADETGYAPCTPQAVMELLKHFGIPLKGKRVTLVGRSMVVGKPLSMLLLKEHATITICHTRTADLAGECRKAEILIAAAGVPKMVKDSFVNEGATVIDVGINVDENGNLCGDVDFESVEPVAGSITPVPGGVGTVTTSVLAMHVIEACEKGEALGRPS
ncbi:MAG: bifunctional 5,10-methylene-tetrahydrofolate dehydrogenase/5,10-methylene-tetrahydrofolate cyclohydrolase [Clostridiales bacterium]|nr:bifunctional 5,10-methylene-tetrahydrofolate dehydrogenase/5,10-methylene-tetrahydrofolate cyclohydrolase [Clostridiales bacterium]